MGQHGRYGQGVGDRPVTARGRDVPPELVDDGKPVRTARAVDAFLSHIRGLKDAALVTNDGTAHRYENRFLPTYAKKRYRELLEANREIHAEFDEVYTVLLTLTGARKNAAGQTPSHPADHGQPRAPVDYLCELDASHEYVVTCLADQLETRYARLSVLEPYTGEIDAPEIVTDGYPHLHIGLWLEEKPEIRPLLLALGKHIKHSPAVPDPGSAQTRSGQQLSDPLDPRASPHVIPERELTIRRAQRTVYPSDIDKPVDPLIRYLAKFAGKIGGAPQGILDLQRDFQRFSMIVWATNKRLVRMNKTFRTHKPTLVGEDTYLDDPAIIDGPLIELDDRSQPADTPDSIPEVDPRR